MANQVAANTPSPAHQQRKREDERKPDEPGNGGAEVLLGFSSAEDGGEDRFQRKDKDHEHGGNVLLHPYGNEITEKSSQ